MEKLAVLQMQKVAAIAAVIALLFWYFVYNDGSSINTQITALDAELAAEQAKKVKTEETLKKEELMKANLEGLTTQFKEITKRLPVNLSPIDLIRAIEGQARTANVTVKSKRPGNVTVREIADEVPVDLILNGTYTEIAQFIYLVTTTERMMRIRSFNLHATVAEQPTNLQFEGQLVAYKMGTEKPIEKKGAK